MFLPTPSTSSLQATLAAATAGDEPVVLPHHPINCRDGMLGLEEDGTLCCDHAATDDARVQRALIHSVAILLLECAFAQFGGPVDEKKVP